MPIEAACSRVLATLAGLYPKAAPELEILHEAATGCVIRARLGDDHYVVAKLSAPALLAPYANRLIAVHPQMAQGRNRVPEPLFYDAEQGLILMEDTWGQRADALFLKGDAAAERVLQAAGAWIARFHATSQTQAAFNPDPHLNWIGKAITAHKSGARLIPDCDGLRALLPELEARAEAARGAMVLRSITHRDFHLGNLLIRKQGRTYGIDFENAARDENLRDLLFFLCDCAKLHLSSPTPESLHAMAQSLRQAYGRSPAAAPVRRFFQLAFAMAAWADLDAAAPPGPKRRRAFEVIRLLTQAGDVFADP